MARLDQQMLCALDLMQRLPPQNIEKNLSDVIDLVPDLLEDLCASVDPPLKVARDKETGKDYLLCDYNRDGDSYRSPWSNKYDPPLPDGAVPSDRIRQLEIAANQAFDTYRELYFEDGLCSVFLWDTENGFAGVILIKKAGVNEKIKACWDSMHVVEVQEKGDSHNAYKLTSTVMLWLNIFGMNLGGYIKKQRFADFQVNDISSHIVNIGRMVEDMENVVYSKLNEIYFGKTKDIVNCLRSIGDLKHVNHQKRLAANLKRLKIS